MPAANPILIPELRVMLAEGRRLRSADLGQNRVARTARNLIQGAHRSLSQ